MGGWLWASLFVRKAVGKHLPLIFENLIFSMFIGFVSIDIKRSYAYDEGSII